MPAVQDTPDIDVIVTFDVKNQTRIAHEWPGSQTRQFQFVGIARRASRRMSGDMIVGVLKRIDEAERDPFASVSKIVIDGLFDIPVGSFTRDDGLAAHVLSRRRTRWRRLSK